MVEATAETQTYISVDSYPEVASLRQEVRDDAWALVHSREQQLANDQEFMLPLTIDALSTAQHVNQAEQNYGEASIEYQNSRAGLELDCTRLVAEWYRKLRPEYFPLSRHYFDAKTGDFFSHGLSIRQMTENALRPVNDDPEEVGRRVNERVENETPLILRKVGGIALKGTKIRTISECTDKAITDYQSDIKNSRPHSGYNGYVPEIEKVMLRDWHLDTETDDRLEEQIGLPGIYINHFVIQQALRKREFEAGNLDKTGLHGTQLLAKDDLIEFVRLLDETASEEWCVNIFMGEQVDDDHPKDYDGIREEARLRQEGHKDMAATVANFIQDLEGDGTDGRKAPALVEEFVKLLLLNECKKDIKLAPQIFNQKTADGLARVVHLESIGQYEAAQALQLEVQEMAPGGGFCGAGSCGLESVGIGTKEASKMEKIGLDSKDGIKDNERNCRECGAKAVVYDVKNKKKGCLDCGATAKF